MIELRWINKEHTEHLDYSNPTRVLQYRFMYYAGQPEAYWSNWKTVPDDET